jgi:hypothetical protein
MDKLSNSTVINSQGQQILMLYTLNFEIVEMKVAR